MAKGADAPAGAAPDAASQVGAIVEPIKAIGAAIGFAIGAWTTHRAGGDWTDSVFHGIVGGVLLSLIAWFGGLVLVREAIRAKVDAERADYDARVDEAKRRVVEVLRERGHDVPDGYLDGPPRRPELGQGR